MERPSSGTEPAGRGQYRLSPSQFGLGFWQAWWTWALCTADIVGISGNATEEVSLEFAGLGAGSLLLLVSTLGYPVVTVAILHPGRFRQLAKRLRSVPVLAALCCTLGTVGMALAVNREPLSAWWTGRVFVLAASLFSLGNALLLIMWGERWSTLASGQVGRYLYMSYIVAIAAFFALGVLPLPVRVACGSLFPVISSVILCGSHNEPRRAPRRLPYEQERPPLVRPAVAMVALNVVWGIGLPCAANMTSGTNPAINGLALAGICLVGLVCYMAYTKPAVEAFAIERPVYAAFAGGFLLIQLLPGDLAFIGYGVATLGGACLDMLVMLVACDLAFRLRLPVAITLGCSMFVSRIGSFAGRAFYDIALAGIPDTMDETLLLCALTVCTCGFAVFGRAELEALYRTKPAAPHKGTIDDRCNALAAEINLTPREKEILKLLACGRNAPFVAQQLGISTGTVKNHISNIYRKADVGDRQGLINALDQADRARCNDTCQRAATSNGDFDKS